MGVFRRPFSLEPEKVKVIALAIITLHNLLRKDSSYGKVYIPSELVDNEDITMVKSQRQPEEKTHQANHGILCL